MLRSLSRAPQARSAGPCGAAAPRIYYTPIVRPHNGLRFVSSSVAWMERREAARNPGMAPDHGFGCSRLRAEAGDIGVRRRAFRRAKARIWRRLKYCCDSLAAFVQHSSVGAQ